MPSSSSEPMPIALLIAAVLGVARLGHADVEGVARARRARARSSQSRREQAIGLDRDLGVAEAFMLKITSP